MLGRPSSYPENIDLDKVKLLCKKGFTDRDLADFFGVTEQTINNWKIKHPEFFESIKEGKCFADELVEKSLFERAIGYEHYEDKIFCSDGVAIVEPTVKHYPPETVAAIFWLKNRKPEQWRDKSELEHSGTISISEKLREARERSKKR
jgi:DNA-binding XRE family transcriptional regulator